MFTCLVRVVVVVVVCFLDVVVCVCRSGVFSLFVDGLVVHI